MALVVLVLWSLPLMGRMAWNQHGCFALGLDGGVGRLGIDRLGPDQKSGESHTVLDRGDWRSSVGCFCRNSFSLDNY
jgi:hypothetical protein